MSEYIRSKVQEADIRFVTVDSTHCVIATWRIIELLRKTMRQLLLINVVWDTLDQDRL